MGLTDFVGREDFVSMHLPLNDRLKFFSGTVCGQAVMAAIAKLVASAINRLAMKWSNARD